MKYRKKPVEIDAEVYHPGLEDGFSCIPLAFECLRKNKNGKYKDCDTCDYETEKLPFIKSLEGNMYISEGDWIITGVKGERYPCKPDIFDLTYEPAIYVTAGFGDACVQDEYCKGCGKLKVLCTHSTTGCM